MREIEAKFRVHPPYRIPELVGDETGVAAVTGPVVRELRAVYWDTIDLRLAREGITLRHRAGEGDKDGWHLKLPVHEAGVPDGSTGARDEIHESGPEATPPEALRDLVAAHVRGAVLGPVATLLTTRSAYELVDAEGSALAELTDDLVSVLDQGHVAGRFREIEVEDTGGGMDVLALVGERLRSAGAVGGEFVPKVVRALGPQATADPDPPQPGTVTIKEPARLAIRAVLRRYVRVFMAQDTAVRQQQPDAVHQMRVAARRLRSALKTFGPLVDDTWAKSLREELKWVADGLGAARDGEVLLARLLRDIAKLPPEAVVGGVQAKVEAAVGGDLTAANAAAGELLRTERYMALLDRLVDAAWEPMTTGLAEASTAEALPDLVGFAWQRLAREAARVRKPDATEQLWHEARIAAKQARYAAEAVVPFFGRPAKALAAQAEEVQELLGEHQDAAVAAGVIRKLATAPKAGSSAFTLGLLYAEQQRAMEAARDAFPALWSAASKAKHRRWLHG